MASKAEYYLLTDEGDQHKPISSTRKPYWIITILNVVLFVFSCSASLRAVGLEPLAKGSSLASGKRIAQTEQLPEITAEHYWWTEYSRGSEAELDALWDAILPSHGFIAVDERWAASKHWPESMRLPQDQSKRVYLLEAYHQLHCLTIIRKTFFELSNGRNIANTTYPASHAGHCFDALRQHIQCHADNTPLFAFGDNTAGDAQVHRCKDWNALREFATEHTACYRDSVHDILLGEHFGYCDNGWDGVKDVRPINFTLTETL